MDDEKSTSDMLQDNLEEIPFSLQEELVDDSGIVVTSDEPLAEHIPQDHPEGDN